MGKENVVHVSIQAGVTDDKQDAVPIVAPDLLPELLEVLATSPSIMDSCFSRVVGGVPGLSSRSS